jgi:DNA-directed RNA polymerase specialized sigma24 family protein
VKLSDRLISPDLNPEQELLWREAREGMRRQIDKLPESQRDLVLRHYGFEPHDDCWTIPQLAAYLRRTPRQVRYELEKALKALREVYCEPEGR